jgi:hypothetical protein
MTVEPWAKLTWLGPGIHLLSWNGETYQLFADRQGFVPVPTLERT